MADGPAAALQMTGPGDHPQKPLSQEPAVAPNAGSPADLRHHNTTLESAPGCKARVLISQHSHTHIFPLRYSGKRRANTMAPTCRFLPTAESPGAMSAR